MIDLLLSQDITQVSELDDFKKNEERYFQFVDQDEAKRIDDTEIRSSRSLEVSQALIGTRYEGKVVSLPSGAIVHRGGVFQKIGESYQIKLSSVDYGWAVSEPLPDHSRVYFPTSLISTSV